VFGYYLLGEAITLGQIAGGSVVLLGLYVMRTAREAERPLADTAPGSEPGTFEP
jgi:drug/metabolite transporter (DMT)-like permease